MFACHANQHLIFTSVDMDDGNTKGMTYESGMCNDYYSSSIVQLDEFKYYSNDVEYTAKHLLAHSLGAKHDFDTTCDENGGMFFFICIYRLSSVCPAYVRLPCLFLFCPAYARSTHKPQLNEFELHTNYTQQVLWVMMAMMSILVCVQLKAFQNFLIHIGIEFYVWEMV